MRVSVALVLVTCFFAEVTFAQTKPYKRRSKKNKAPATNSEVAPSDPTGSTNIGEEPPPSSTNDSEMTTDATSRGPHDPKKVSDSKVATQGTIRGPGWMFALGLTATPGEFYESSVVSAITTLGQATVSLKSTSDDSEISYNAKPQFASLASTYQAKTSSKKFAYGVSTDVTRSIGKGDVTSGGVKASISTKDDNPSTSAFVSAQVRPGLWFGFGSKWGN